MMPRLSRRPAAILALAAAAIVLAGCNNRDSKTDDDLKRQLDQLVQVSRDQLAAEKDTGLSAKSALDELRKVSARLDEMEKLVREASTSQKRAAIYLPMEAETVCDNDASCTNTARAICNKISYPRAITSRYTPGTRPTLNSVVCFD